MHQNALGDRPSIHTDLPAHWPTNVAWPTMLHWVAALIDISDRNQLLIVARSSITLLSDMPLKQSVIHCFVYFSGSRQALITPSLLVHSE